VREPRALSLSATFESLPAGRVRVSKNPAKMLPQNLNEIGVFEPAVCGVK
jgi:hypothetical protein